MIFLQRRICDELKKKMKTEETTTNLKKLTMRCLFRTKKLEK